MRYLSVCSGIEAATVAWHPLGWEAAAFSEIEAFPRAVLQHHYPHVPLHGDFTTIQGDEYGTINLLVGGTPCQDFSVAGLRAGFAGNRGNLTLSFVELAARLRPEWILWENVPGVLSIERGMAFRTFLNRLAECGYGFAYRILDAQYFGVPQRRRRVFVVGYLGDWRPPAAVLFEPESLRGDITPRRGTGTGVACTIGARTCRSIGAQDADCGHIIANALTSRYDSSAGSGGGLPLVAASVGGNQAGPIDVATALNYGGTGRMDFDSETFIAPSLTSSPYADNSGREGKLVVEQQAIALQEVGKRTGKSTDDTRAGIGIAEEGDPMFTLQAGAQHGVACYPINTQMGTRGAETSNSSREGIGLGNEGDPAFTLQSSHPHAVACFKGGQGAKAGGIGYDENLAPTLGAADSGTNRTPALLQSSAVRRLTVVECERLQAFPDNYTLVPYRGKPAADGPRYKALGNSMHVGTMHWLGCRIQMVSNLLKERRSG